MYLIVKLKTEMSNNRKTTRCSIGLIPCDEHKKTLSIRAGEIFTKTLFISFETTKELACMSNSFKKHYTTQSFSLNPHLSLAYKNLSKQKRLIIADETKLMFDEVRFSGVRAVTTPTQTKTENDIKRWKSIYFKSLI